MEPFTGLVMALPAWAQVALLVSLSALAASETLGSTTRVAPNSLYQLAAATLRILVASVKRADPPPTDSAGKP